MSWFRQWQAFMKGKSFDLPGPIDNTTILVDKNGVQTIKPGIFINDIYNWVIKGSGSESVNLRLKLLDD